MSRSRCAEHPDPILSSQRCSRCGRGLRFARVCSWDSGTRSRVAAGRPLQAAEQSGGPGSRQRGAPRSPRLLPSAAASAPREGRAPRPSPAPPPPPADSGLRSPRDPRPARPPETVGGEGPRVQAWGRLPERGGSPAAGRRGTERAARSSWGCRGRLPFPRARPRARPRRRPRPGPPLAARPGPSSRGRGPGEAGGGGPGRSRWSAGTGAGEAGPCGEAPLWMGVGRPSPGSELAGAPHFSIANLRSSGDSSSI